MKYGIKISSQAIASLAFALLTFGLSAQPTHQEQWTFLREGVVVNQQQKEIYISTPDSSVQALSLTTGQPLWTSSQLKGKPLALTNGNLVVLASRRPADDLAIANLDITNKGAIKTRNSLNLPGNVKANLVQSPKSMFRLWAKPVNGELYFYWDFMQISLSGIARENSDTATTRSGAFKQNRVSQRLSPVNKSLLPENFNKQSILHDGQKKSPSVQSFISRDQRTILTSEKIANDTVFNSYRWQFYERSNNTMLGEIYDYRSYAPFIVSGNLLIYETGPYITFKDAKSTNVPLMIVAIDLTTQKEVWRKAILDTIYRGPTPP